MKYISPIILFILLNTFLNSVHSQRAEFKWKVEVFNPNYYTGYYNQRKYSETQIRNTYYLLYKNTLWFRHSYNTTPFKLEDVALLSLDSLDNELKIIKTILDSSEYVESEYWERIKEERIKEYESFYELKRIALLGNKNPDTLKYFYPANNHCDTFANILINGGQEMIDAWINMHEKQKETNSNLEFRARFKEQYNSKYRSEYARIELLSFGWWNCAQLYFYRAEDSDMEEEFKKLFKKVEKTNIKYWK